MTGERREVSTMKAKCYRRQAWGAAIAFMLLAVLLGGCDSREPDTLNELIEMEGGEEAVGPERISELKQQIEQYRDVVEEKVQAAGQLGVYYKMLARAYMDRQMYGLALDTIDEAVRIETDNPVLFYMAGVAAGHMGKAAGTEAEAVEYFEMAERYYNRAIELNPEYLDALYGLAVLYAFELDRPDDALELLERANEVEPNRARPYMLKGRVLVELGQPEEAAEAYGRAAETAASKEVRDAALENRRRILGESQQ
jgi:tetratricopeptide (TPR) repeat protein